MSRKLRLITLDLTDTVFRFRRSPVSMYREVGAAHGIDCNEEDVARGLRAAVKGADAHFGARTHGDSEKWWTRVVHETFKEAIGSGYAEDRIQPVARELYINYATQAPYEVFPDATKFLDSMQAARDARKVRVGALTNFDRRIYSLVSSLGLSTKFDFITCSEDAGSSKPEPEIFRKAAQQSNQASLTPDQILHVGDDLRKDYLGARAVGWNALFIDRSGERNISKDFGVDISHVCKDFDEVHQRIIDMEQEH